MLRKRNESGYFTFCTCCTNTQTRKDCDAFMHCLLTPMCSCTCRTASKTKSTRNSKSMKKCCCGLHRVQDSSSVRKKQRERGNDGNFESDSASSWTEHSSEESDSLEQPAFVSSSIDKDNDHVS